MTNLGRNEQPTIGKLFFDHLIGNELPAFEVAGHISTHLQHDLVLALGKPKETVVVEPETVTDEVEDQVAEVVEEVTNTVEETVADLDEQLTEAADSLFGEPVAEEDKPTPVTDDLFDPSKPLFG